MMLTDDEIINDYAESLAVFKSRTEGETASVALQTVRGILARKQKPETLSNTLDVYLDIMNEVVNDWIHLKKKDAAVSAFLLKKGLALTPLVCNGHLNDDGTHVEKITLTVYDKQYSVIWAGSEWFMSEAEAVYDAEQVEAIIESLELNERNEGTPGLSIVYKLMQGLCRLESNEQAVVADFMTSFCNSNGIVEETV